MEISKLKRVSSYKVRQRGDKSCVYISDLMEARALLENNGGWLLDLGSQSWLVTSDEGIILDMRGQTYLDRCHRYQQWDETLLLPGDGTAAGILMLMAEQEITLGDLIDAYIAHEDLVGVGLITLRDQLRTIISTHLK